MFIQKLSQLPKEKNLPPIISFDSEQADNNVPEGFSIAWAEYKGLTKRQYKGVYVPLRHKYPVNTSYVNMPFNEVRDWLASVLKNRKVVMHNAEYDLFILRTKYKIEIPLENVEDTLLAHWCIDTNRLHALKEIRKKEYGRIHLLTYKEARLAGIKAFVKYGENDAIETLMLYNDLMKQFKKLPKTYELYRSVEIPFIECMAYMNRYNNMIRIDEKLLKEYMRMADKESEIAESVAKEAFVSKLGDEYKDMNLNSQKQLSQALVKVGYKLQLNEDTGNYICDERALNDLHRRKADLILELMIYIRGINKLNNTYVTKLYDLLEEVDKNVFVLSGYQFNHHGTETGRLCVSGDTVLDTDNGSFCISTLDLTQPKKFRILTHTTMPQVIKNLFYKGKEEMYEVKTESGKSITCTKGHRFWTPQGWKQLGSIKEGEQVFTYAYSGSTKNEGKKSDIERERFCEPCTQDNTNEETVGREVQGKRACVVNFNEVLQKQISRGSSAETQNNLRKFKMGKQVWHTQTRSSAIKSRVIQLFKSGLLYISNSTENERIGMVCEKEYRLPQTTSSGIKSVSVNRAPSGIAKGVGTIFQRFNEFYEKLFQQSVGIFQPLIHSFWERDAGALVYSKNIGQIQLLQGEKPCTKESYLLEYEQSGVDSVFSSFAKESSAHKTVLYSQTLYDRFLFSFWQFVSGNRWRLSREQQENTTIRQSETKYCQTNEIQVNTFHRQASNSGCAESSFFNTERIVSIISVGIKDVWDIEVENDHSYLAQGFVNHNSSTSPNMQNMPRDKVLMRYNFYLEARKLKLLPKTYKFITDDDEREIKKLAEKNKKLADLLDKCSVDIRKIFIPMPGNVFIGADYSQIELRMAAHLSGCKNMIDAFIHNVDIHQQTADKVNKLLGQDVFTRQDAKPVNFGILYGLYYKTFAKANQMEIKKAELLFATWWKVNHEIRTFVDGVYKSARKSHFVQTILGRRRNMHTSGINDEVFWKRNHAENACISTIVSGSSADLIKSAMLKLIKYKDKLEMKLQVHDELLFEVKKEDAEKYKVIVKKEMESAMQLKVPVIADVKIGTSWRNVH